MYPLKTPGNLSFSDVFRGLQKRNIGVKQVHYIEVGDERVRLNIVLYLVGYKGNLGERKQTLVWSIVLALPILVSQLYLILWQTYV